MCGPIPLSPPAQTARIRAHHPVNFAEAYTGGHRLAAHSQAQSCDSLVNFWVRRLCLLDAAYWPSLIRRIRRSMKCFRLKGQVAQAFRPAFACGSHSDSLPSTAVVDTNRRRQDHGRLHECRAARKPEKEVGSIPAQVSQLHLIFRLEFLFFSERITNFFSERITN